MNRETMSLPMVALRGITILPEMVRHFDVSRPKSVKAIEEVVEGNQKIFLTAQKDGDVEEPELTDVYRTGCVATVRQIIKLPRKVSRVLITGEERAYINTIEFEEPYLRANITVIPDTDSDTDLPNTEAMLRGLKDIFKEYLSKNPKLSKELAAQIENIGVLKKLVDVIGANVPFSYTDAQQLLEETDLVKRYELLSFKLMNEIQIMNVKDEIQAKVKKRVDKNQREYILREEAKLIREELGDDSTLSDGEEFQQKTDDLEASEEVKKKLKKEIRRFQNTLGSQAENGVIRTYIETMLEMPWDKVCEESEDIESAKKILEEDHYGLEKVKERVLEFLAVRTLTKKGNTPILCLAGPPGTGKTSIAKSLARALNKPYVRISLGGVRDEAEIRGHRKTYVGAMPGRIASGLRQAEVKNPLMLLDEIDKVSNDYKGDTFSALLEVLDSEQNRKFRDHYLEVPVDLSEVLFVATANTLQPIPRPLLDRMEVIEVSSYTANEKFHIAKEHLAAKQFGKNGLDKGQLSISDGALKKMIECYTREAGVRDLERKIGSICRKAAKEILQKKKESVKVTSSNLEKYLGKEKYGANKANEKDEVGIVRGLAWTSVGGETLQVEVNVMPGKGETGLTGQMGDVMKESALTGLSYVRSVSGQYGIPKDTFRKNDFHIHIPEGAVPKDGPSAGITMATALLSAITGIAVRADLAMTGEITLRGRVLPIGGLKEKILAAKTAGIKTVLVPKKNEKDIGDIASEIKAGLSIHFVENMEEVLSYALAEKPLKENLPGKKASRDKSSRDKDLRDKASRKRS